MNSSLKDHALSKVPEVTLSFWIIKIAATTLGETGGESVTMTLFHADKNAHNGGYLIGTALFFAILVGLVIWQIAAKRFHPFLYWATIVASTTFGTTMADFADRSLGIGYTGGSSVLFGCLMTVLGLWYWSEGTISVNTVATPRVEAFYWAAITFSQTLGTALGDWLADTGGLGYEGGALVFAAGLAVLAGLYFWSGASRVLLFCKAACPLYAGKIPNADEHGIEGTRWTEFVTRVEPGDLTVNTKKRLSAFYARVFLLYQKGRDSRMFTSIPLRLHAT